MRQLPGFNLCACYVTLPALMAGLPAQRLLWLSKFPHSSLVRSRSKNPGIYAMRVIWLLLGRCCWFTAIGAAAFGFRPALYAAGRNFH